MVHIPSSQIGIVVVKTLILVIGGLITDYSYKAYERTDAPEHRMLALGFGIVTVGAILGGVLDLGVGTYPGMDLIYTSVLVSSSMTALAWVSSSTHYTSDERQSKNRSLTSSSGTIHWSFLPKTS